MKKQGKNNNSLKLYSRFRLIKKKPLVLISIVIVVLLIVKVIDLILIRNGAGVGANESSFASVKNDTIITEAVRIFYEDSRRARGLLMEENAKIPPSDVLRKMKYLNLIGASYQVEDDYAQALNYYYQALKCSPDEIDSSFSAIVYNNIGYVYQRTGDFKTALNYMLRSLKMNSGKSFTSGTLNNIALVYLSVGSDEKGEQYLRSALESDKKLKSHDLNTIAMIYNNLGSIYLRKNQLDSAYRLLQKSIAIANGIGNQGIVIRSYNNLGDLYAMNGESDKAATYYSKGMDIASQINAPFSKVYSLKGLSQICLEKQEFKKALSYTDEAYGISMNIGNDILIYECKRLYSDIYSRKGDYRKGFEYLQDYLNLKEKFINQNTIRQVYNEEISVLNESNKIKQLEIERKELQLSRKNIFVFAVSIGALLGLAGLYFVFMYYKSKQNAKMQSLVIEMNEKKSRSVIEAEISERKRIGQELHDGLGQMLSVARLNLTALSPNKRIAKERQERLVNSAMYSIDTAFNELRHISHNLAPTILTTKGLEEAVLDIVTRVNESSKIDTSCEIFGLNGHFDSLMENTLYRAIQELINNVIKHAHANKIVLQLVQTDEEIMLMIEDNGIGFDPNNENSILKGGGLQNIKSRIENLHGTIFIDSKRDRGTIISISIPLNYK